MPARSKVQQRLMAMALHAPSKIHKRNRGVLSMSEGSLRDFASTPTKKLPRRKRG